ncbi:hypothetical protein JBKA6_1298 [Ichthyobacterium seriolicida]|uniref:DUF2147 domain-containing protein n=2 Tax=Ichthyobacterium seriolicida TaxID=242600 RepID=A0A1J1DZG9_9FLAO|nr:hypothetical protein JBKA6_1298 [Ichthyobacterium seriolicida]
MKQDGKIYGKIVELLNREKGDENPVCDKCPGSLKNQPVVGMEIVKEMEYDDGEYEDGSILDPGNGKFYDCKMWMDASNYDVLYVRGYIFLFFRTQKWYRVKENI